MKGKKEEKQTLKEIEEKFEDNQGFEGDEGSKGGTAAPSVSGSIRSRKTEEGDGPSSLEGDGQKEPPWKTVEGENRYIQK